MSTALPPAPTILTPASAPAGDDVRAEVRLAAAGDGAAYAGIVRRYQQSMSRRMRHFARNSAELETLVQDVFVEAYFSLGNYRGDAHFSHWLMRIATRVGYRHWKHKRRDDRRREKLQTASAAGAMGMTHAPASDAAAESSDAAEKLAALLQKLPPRDRLVVTLMYVEGHSIQEAARLTGWSQTMVKVQAFRARGKLKKLMSASGE